MDIFGIGPLEIALILILVIIIFGPKDLAKTGKTIGKSLNKLVRSDTWKTINQTTQELRNLPNRLMREAGMEELEQTIKGGNATSDEHTIRPPMSGKPDSDTPQKLIATPANPPEIDPAASSNPETPSSPDKDYQA